MRFFYVTVTCEPALLIYIRNSKFSGFFNTEYNKLLQCDKCMQETFCGLAIVIVLRFQNLINTKRCCTTNRKWLHVSRTTKRSRASLQMMTASPIDSPTYETVKWCVWALFLWNKTWACWLYMKPTIMNYWYTPAKNWLHHVPPLDSKWYTCVALCIISIHNVLNIAMNTDDLAQRIGIKDELKKSHYRPLEHTRDPPKGMSLRENAIDNDLLLTNLQIWKYM